MGTHGARILAPGDGAQECFRLGGLAEPSGPGPFPFLLGIGKGPAGRRRDFAGAEDGIDEEASFRELLKALQARRITIFEKYACVLSGGTWTRDLHSRAGFDVDPCCPVCRDTRETPIHRWWVCPRWDVLGSHEGRKLAIDADAADWQPRCLWECGFFPAPNPEDCPLRPRTGRIAASPGRGGSPESISWMDADASATRPKDLYLRRAACAFWAGDSKSDSAAWSLPGPAQTVYRVELFAILVALGVFRGDVEVVSDCTGVVDEAECIRVGGRVSPTSRHAELWFR